MKDIEKMEELTGGRAGIYKRENCVVRPLHPWSSTIHKLLLYYHEQGFTKCPQFIGVEDEHEVLTFLEGETYDYPLVGPIGSERALFSAAKILRQLHDASESFPKIHNMHEERWMFPAREPHEVICHGDYTPYNVALQGDTVVGVFDFDVSHPAPRIWDLAFSTYSWAPFKTDPGCKKGTINEQIPRARLFCDAYGATLEHREQLVAVAVERLEGVVDFMIGEAEKGDVKFKQDVDAGHHLGYLADIEYLQTHREAITEGLLV